MRRIGIIDSGIGGLSILQKLIHRKVNAKFYYISDEDNVPYGEKSQLFMYNQMCIMTEKLLDKNIEAILIACNTATAETIDRLREKYQVPFVGIEPYINFVNKMNLKDSNIALILTRATYNSTRFKSLLQSLDPLKRVQIFPQEKLALIIEKLKYKKFYQIQAEVDKELKFLEDETFTHVILGCTHYPIISKYIESAYNVKTVDPSDFVINHLISQLKIESTPFKNSTFYYNHNNSEQWKVRDLDSLNFLNIQPKQSR